MTDGITHMSPEDLRSAQDEARTNRAERDQRLIAQRQPVQPVAEKATQRQLDFLLVLVQERVLPEQTCLDMMARIEAGAVTKRRASDWIERLKALPKRLPQANVASKVRVQYANMQTDKPGADKRVGYLVGLGDRNVPAGRYALKQNADQHNGNDVAFYRLWIGERGGWALHLCHGPEETRMSTASATAILGLISDNLEDAFALYGHRIGKCGVCSRRLTNAISRKRGIGPVCYVNLGRLF